MFTHIAFLDNVIRTQHALLVRSFYIVVTAGKVLLPVSEKKKLHVGDRFGCSSYPGTSILTILKTEDPTNSALL